MTAAIVPPQGPPRDLKPVDSVLERSEDLTSDSDSEEEADEMGSLSGERLTLYADRDWL